MSDLSGRTCVVTGATRGIGRAAAEAVAARGATVVVHGRDPAAVDSTCREIAAATANQQISGVVGRFDSLAEVREMAQEIGERFGRVDVLLNNAGTGAVRRTTTSDGFEWLFGVNHLAPFLLTNLLLDRLRASSRRTFLRHRASPAESSDGSRDPGSYPRKPARKRRSIS
jgi:NAD(P)-dependent dehydrogenase (short-subunit alcohol dehydrogenase family)